MIKSIILKNNGQTSWLFRHTKLYICNNCGVKFGKRESKIKPNQKYIYCSRRCAEIGRHKK